MQRFSSVSTLTLSVLAMGMALLGVGCVRTTLPADRPENFTIEWTKGGGMNPEGSSATISAQASSWTFDHYESGARTEERYDFVATDEELDALYGVMRKYAVDKIREVDGDIDDGDDAGLVLRWNDEYLSLWGMAVYEADTERYQAAYTAIAEFLRDKVPNAPSE